MKMHPGLIKKKKRKRTRRKKIQGRDAVWIPNDPFPAYRAESMGQRKALGESGPLVLCHEDPPATVKSRAEPAGGPRTGKDKGYLCQQLGQSWKE